MVRHFSVLMPSLHIYKPSICVMLVAINVVDLIQPRYSSWVIHATDKILSLLTYISELLYHQLHLMFVFLPLLSVT